MDRGRRLINASVLWPLVACVRPAGSQETSRMYKWLPTESAPERYPAFLIRGALLLPDGSAVAVPGRRDVSNGWGRRGSVHLVGPETKPLPTRLELRWFSYAEDKFYQGNFELPLARLEAFFKTGVAQDRQTRRRAEFERIIVGMAPGGVVAVWLAAGAERVEVAAYQAEPADLPWTEVLDNPAVPRAVYIQKVLSGALGPEGLAQLRRDGVPARRYADYRRQYRWRPWVTGAGVSEDIRIESFNGEDAFIGASGPAVPREQRPVPARLRLQWAAPGGPAMQAEVGFDETETFAAFAKLAQGDAQRQLALQLDTTAAAVSVALRDEKLVLPLHKARVEVSRR